ncbi:unnamed protein product [Brassica oleracea]
MQFLLAIFFNVSHGKGKVQMMSVGVYMKPARESCSYSTNVY